MPCVAGSPRAYCTYYSASGLPPGLCYSSSCSLLFGSNSGPESAFLCLPDGHSLLASLLWLPSCFPAGKQGAALLVLTPQQRSWVLEGKKLAVHLVPERCAPQGITAEMCCGAFWLLSTLSPLGLFGYTTLAILKNSSAASRAMSRSCQSKRVLWLLQAVSGVSMARVLPPQLLSG